jgi:predicted nucleic acid-binding protein
MGASGVEYENHCCTGRRSRTYGAGIYRRGGENCAHSGSAQGPYRTRKRSQIGVTWRSNAGVEEYSSAQGPCEVILADTSIWIDHLRKGNKELRELLNQGQIVIHPFIIAELALGFFRARDKTLTLFDLLPQVRVAQLSEVRHLIEARHLYGLGIGLIDAHLIASALIDPSTRLWTRDKQLRKAAEGLGIHGDLR